jgi:hypothetical protein
VSFSDYLENILVQYVAGNYTFYLALSLTDPGENGGGVTEPTGGGYSRQAVGDVTVTGSSITNDDDIEFDAATEAWGEILYAVLYDAAEDGNFLGYYLLPSPIDVVIGTVIRVLAENMLVTIE